MVPRTRPWTEDDRARWPGRPMPRLRSTWTTMGDVDGGGIRRGGRTICLFAAWPRIWRVHRSRAGSRGSAQHATTLRGPWATRQFTLSPHPAPAISSLELSASGSSETAAVTIVGQVEIAEEDAAGLIVEFDHDNDGIVEGRGRCIRRQLPIFPAESDGRQCFAAPGPPAGMR